VVDILLDHILARQWELHTDIPYSDFTQWVYALIPEYLDGLEEPVVMRLESMVRHQWVDGYDTMEKLHEVFVRMDRRAKFPSRFVQGIQDIQQHYELFSGVFVSFYGGLKIALKEDLQTRPVYP
jgi:acyl carrier protein phosphodiesterase